MRTVAVVGGGLAGLAAVLESSLLLTTGFQNNSTFVVYLIEKRSALGGNSAKASSGINCALSRHQQALGIHDTVDCFIADTIKSGAGHCSVDMVDILARGSVDALSWLERGRELELSQLSHCGGHSVARTHKEQKREDGKPASIGWDIIKTLKARLPETVKVLTNHRLVKILQDVTGKVNGIHLEHESNVKSLSVDALILCTGGFSADWSDTSLLRQWIPQSPLFQQILSRLPKEKTLDLQTLFPTTNGPFALGEGLKVAQEIGARTKHLKYIQLHPTGFVDPKDPHAHTKFLAPEAFRAHGGILISPLTGTRFVNELETRDHVSMAIFEHCTNKDGNAFAYLLMNNHVSESFDPASVGFYLSKGLIGKGTVEDLVSTLGFPVTADELRSVLDAYNKNEGQDEFGKKSFPTKFRYDQEPVLWAIVTPSIHYTMGGLDVTPNCEVLRDTHEEESKLIPGLFAAGEVSAGVHGENRLAGNSLLECVVFGRRVARSAVAYLQYLQNK